MALLAPLAHRELEQPAFDGAVEERRLAILAQAQLAGRAGVSRQWVSEVEGGKRAGVEFGAVLDVAGALGLELVLRDRPAPHSPTAADEGQDALDAHLRALGLL